jgi:hypothetical protein
MLKDLFSSKKFIALIFGVTAVIVADVCGVSTATLGWITATLGAYLLSQGLSDFGKDASAYQAEGEVEKAKIESQKTDSF